MHTRKTVTTSVIAMLLSVSSLTNVSIARQTTPAGEESCEGMTQGPGNEGASHFGGPSSVGGQLKHDTKGKASVFSTYFDFKKKLNKEHGFAFGFDYNTLYQYANKSLGKDDGASGALRFFGSWTLLNRGSENTGTLTYKVENRHRLGPDITPQQLGAEVGYAGLTATAFSDKDWILTNLFWDQQLWGNRLAFVAGVVDATDYVDVYGQVSPWTDFSNQAFLSNPTIPVPDQGLGAAVRAMLTNQIYMLGGVADANGDPSHPGDSFESFFDIGEYFTHLEFGWIPSFDRRFTDNIHLTAWHADKRQEAQVPSGWGLALSFNRLLDDRWEPFVRLGYADDGGVLWDRSVSVGLGYRPARKGDQFGLGLNWSRPSAQIFGAGLSDQYTAEFYYRFQLTKTFAITPDVQLLVNPALNPNEDMVSILGIRGRLSF